MRKVKQFIYGFFYLAILAFLIYSGINHFFLKDRCIENCEIVTPSSLSVEGEVETFYLSSGAFSSLINIFNPNSGSEAEFYYNLDLYNSNDNLIESLTGRSFIQESSSLNVVFNEILDEEPKRVEFNIEDTIWMDGDNNSSPNVTFSTSSINFSEDEDSLTIFGVVNNESSLNNLNIDVVIILKDSDNQDIFTVKTRLSDVGSRSERDFSVILPTSNDFNDEVDVVNTEFFLYPIF